MTDSKKRPILQSQGNSASSSGEFPHPKTDAALLADPAYVDLIMKYQNAEWVACKEILEALLLKFPDNQHLLDFESAIEMQMTLQRIDSQDALLRRKNLTRSILKNTLFVLLLIIIGIAIVTRILMTYQIQIQKNAVAAQQVQAEGLKTLGDQAKALIQAGKPEMALSIADKIEAVDPDFPDLEIIRSDANAVIQITHLYDEAVLTMEQGQYEQALAIFQQIDSELPLFRDVVARMEAINDHLKVAQLVKEGDAAFEDEAWALVITKYEKALELDPTINSEKIKQQLLSSYLHTVITTLNINEPSIEEIQSAEKYYHKALALIPQSKTYAGERENLQNLSVQLISTKYHQLAKTILVDRNHNERMVATAVDYLNRALTLTPNDAQLNSEVGKAQIYLAALKNFSSGDWENAIDQLVALSAFDSTYPNGMGLQLLYEAYRARGQRYNRGGFYMDARRNFEAAEILAYDQPDNKLRLFEIQVDIGKTIGKLDDFQNAASYFKFAFETINASQIASKYPEFIDAMHQAASLYDQAMYFDSYAAYIELLKDVQSVYAYESVTVAGGESLAFLASQYHSTMQAIRSQNNLGDSTSIQYNSILSIPYIP